MPNWINNKLEIKGNFSDVQIAYDQVRSENDGFDFNGIIPMPSHQPDIKKPNAFWHGDVGEDERNIYGANNEYDWAIQHWGVKWGAQEDSITMSSKHQIVGETTATAYFNTAWAPVTNLMSHFSSQHPKLTFEYLYCDEDDYCLLLEIKEGLISSYKEVEYEVYE